MEFRVNLDTISRIIALVEGKANPYFLYVYNSSLLEDIDQRISWTNITSTSYLELIRDISLTYYKNIEL